MIKILITGANGQLGSDLRVITPTHTDLLCVFTDIETLDITDSQKLKLFLDEHAFDWLINCAAYTAVDKAEMEVDKAYLINKTAVELLASECKQRNIRLIQISTDYVYDGCTWNPYLEGDATNPKSVYGASKLAGEQALIDSGAEYLIIRTSWLYSSFGGNFVKTIRRLATERPQINIIYDQIGSPTYSHDLALTIINIIKQISYSANRNLNEILHYANEGVCSWYDFAKAIVELSNYNCKVNPIETSDYPTPAKRPAYSVCNKKKIKTLYQIEIPYWKDSLANCIAKL